MPTASLKEHFNNTPIKLFSYCGENFSMMQYVTHSISYILNTNYTLVIFFVVLSPFVYHIVLLIGFNKDGTNKQQPINKTKQ